ncbi:MAG: MoxR family ATPase [Chloroflexota bacterium]
MQSAQDTVERIVNNVESVIVGKRAEIELAMMTLLCHGHLLIEDVPGVGKTMLAKSIARSVGCTFKRIQFTPDLLPSDITGVSIFSQLNDDFEFRPGPIMAQIVLADEINRATPKSQSALLECMGERQVTVDGVTYQMPQPFLVMATQNPIEYEGTFPLPEAQLDRFLIRLVLGYPAIDDEIAIIEQQEHIHPIEKLEQVAAASEILRIQEEVKNIHVEPMIKRYVVAIVEATRHHPAVYLGASPRGSLALFRTAQALALIRRRDFVIPDDVKALATATLAHRLIVSPSARMKDIHGSAVIADIVDSVPVPGARASR